MEKRRERIQNYLISLGIRPTLAGFTALVEMIWLWMREQDENRELPRICDLYDNIAIKTGSYRSRVERSVRLAVEKMYEVLDEKDVVRIFGAARKKKDGMLTNGEFVATVALMVAREERKDA